MCICAHYSLAMWVCMHVCMYIIDHFWINQQFQLLLFLHEIYAHSASAQNKYIYLLVIAIATKVFVGKLPGGAGDHRV